MKSRKERNLIKQALTGNDPSFYNIVSYEMDGDYRIAIVANYVIFTQPFIDEVTKLSQKHAFHFWISNTCYAFDKVGLYMIIY